MKIADVLAGKGHRVVAVHPTKPVADLPRLFDDNSISSVAVVDAADRLLGIVTDRIFIQSLARRGPRISLLTAADIMQTPAPTCNSEHSVAAALRTMTEDRVRHLIVLDGGRMTGIVSIGDLVKFRMQDAELESRVLRDMAMGHLAAQVS